ncbi:MAG: TlpA family protein disulfide reductase [Bacteroidales bacterium]|nr:TlpA family protein disulfide reductase [Bacteroidales bacterium]
MRKSILFIALPLMLLVAGFTADENLQKIPSIDIKALDGSVFNTSNIANDGNPIIISFWATWCKPCIQELTTINEVYADWQEETGVKLVAVSIDNTRNSFKVKPFVDSKEWEYEVYLDENGDFKRAMGVNMVPHTFILNGKGEIVWQHTTFSEGGELEMIEIIRKVKKGEAIK